MYRNVLVAVMSLVVGIVYGQTAQFSDQLTSNIQERIANDDMVGVVIGFINGDEIDYFNAGLRSTSDKALVDEHTIFEIGSISKTFTGLMLANNVTLGKMNLDDDIQKYLPDGITAPMHNDETIKLFHLSNHSSALPRMPSNFAPADPTNPYIDYSSDLLYTFLNQHELTRNIGSQYEYSNYAVGLLGQILADHSGQTYEEILKSTITQPLGMTHTGIKNIDGEHAKGHMTAKEVSTWDFDALAGAGAIRSNVSDMMRYLSANMGLSDSPLYPAMQLTHQHSGSANSSPMVGLGWHIMTYEGHEIIWHNGGTGGFTSFMGWIKGTDKGVVVLNNSTNNVDDVGLHVLVPSFPLKKVKKTVSVDDAILESYVGAYALAPTFVLTVTKNGNQLSVGATGQSAFDVYPTSDTSFFYKVVDAKLVFKKDENGVIEGVTLFQAGQELFGKRVE